MNNGYYQIVVRPEYTYKTMFFTQIKHCEFLRTPVGLTNAPRIFQRAMKNLFQRVKFVKTFLDVVLIFSKNKKEYSQHLLEVLDIIEKKE